MSIGTIVNNFVLSRFCKLIVCNDFDVIVNTLYRSVVRLDRDTFNSCRDSLGVTEFSNLEIKDLQSAKILVSEYVDEFALFRDWLNRIKVEASRVRATVCLTSRCNLSCSYCYENGYVKQNPVDMDKETADHFISWLKVFASENDSQDTAIYYYGGEPTLKTDLIKYISKRLEEQLKPLGVTNSFYMYTNGTILSQNLIDTLKKYRFKRLQITLDGPPDIHNKRRVFKNGRGSFGVILNNIKQILDKTVTKILLLVNFDRENTENVSELLDIFVQEGVVNNIEFAFNPVFQTQFNTNHCDNFSLPEFEMYRAWKRLYGLALQKGLSCKPLNIFEKGPCSFCRKSHLIFAPNGDIYKCIGFLGKPQLKVGNVKDSFSKTFDKIEEQIALEPWNNPKCKNCVYLPLCLGGCRFHSYVEYGNITNTFCHKNLIENLELKLIEELARAGDSDTCLLNSL